MGPSNRRGFTLIEIVVVIAVLAILIAMASALTRGVIAGQKRTLTVTRMQAVDAALVQFVMQQKRLPCPADGTLASGNVNAGAEGPRNALTGCNPTTQQNGVVPWRALGLSEADATDGWDRRFTYRTDPFLTADNGMNMSACDPAGGEGGAGPTACTTPCLGTALDNCTPPAKYLNTRGLQVRDVAGTILMNPNTTTPHTGAAYVLISHGESGGGGYLASGQLGVSTVGDGTEEQRNYATQTYVAAASYYVDDALNESPTAAHFDDIVSRPSLLSVITKAGLGPRSH